MWNVAMVNQQLCLMDIPNFGPSTKNTTQNHRARMHVGTTVQVSGSMVFDGRKQDFITLLSDHLKSHGCHTEHTRTDADLLIVQTAIAAANRTTQSTVLIADDTL